MTTKAFAILSFVLLATAGQVKASPLTGPGDFSGFETLIDFNTVPAAVPPPGPFSIGIVTFSESGTGSGSPGWRLLGGFFVPGSRALTDNSGISNIMLEFVVPQLRVGFDVGIGNGISPTTYVVSYLDAGGNLLGSVTDTVGNDFDFFFAGWEDAGGISKVRILETTGDNGKVGGIDNLRHGIPEPTTCTLALAALCLMVGRRRTKS